MPPVHTKHEGRVRGGDTSIPVLMQLGGGQLSKSMVIYQKSVWSNSFPEPLRVFCMLLEPPGSCMWQIVAVCQFCPTQSVVVRFESGVCLVLLPSIPQDPYGPSKSLQS